jgi:chromosome segregation ATPase
MSDDIVARLRRFTANNADWPTIAEAADEVERLRKELNTRIAMCDMRSEKIIELTDEIERLREERDDARREICMNATAEPYRQMCGSGILLPQDEAASRGWDCFKEDGK